VLFLVLQALFPRVVLVYCQAILQQPLVPLQIWVKLVMQVTVIAACNHHQLMHLQHWLTPTHWE